LFTVSASAPAGTAPPRTVTSNTQSVNVALGSPRPTCSATPSFAVTVPPSMTKVLLPSTRE
jgi:hypothetical protein